jgi:hypothetical protein
VRVPDVAVSIAVDDPAAVPWGAVKVTVAAVPGISVMGDGCAVTPAGRPAMVTCTFEENPLWAVASRDTVAGVPLAVKLTAAGMALREKSGGGVACTVIEACVLAVCPFTVVVNITVAVVVVAEEAAVSVNGSATPGISESGDGVIVTPVGSPDTAIVAAPVPAAAASSREAC